ncbi:MAG: protease pro-enzyme activation domain-containing protein [Acidimicrobiales bacterium]
MCLLKHLLHRWVLGAVLTLFLSGIVTLPFTSTAAASTLGPLVRLQALALPPLPVGARIVGAMPANQKMTIDVVLKPSDPTGLSSQLVALYNPKSPEYRRFLTPSQFQQEFGPGNIEKGYVSAWLKSAGLDTGRWMGNAIQIQTTAAAAASAFGVRLDNISMPSGRIAYNATGAPLVPSAISSNVSAVLGLSDVAQMKPALTAAPSHPASSATRRLVVPRSQATPAQTSAPLPCSQASNSGFYTPNQVGDAYGINNLLASGYNGHGVTVAVYELASHSPSDVAAYESCFGLTNPVSMVQVDGGGGAVGGNGTGEADLDIEQVATQAPGASIISYEGPDSGSGPYDTYNAIVQADQAQIISASWADCEPNYFGSGYMSSTNSLFQQAAAQGQSIFAAAGDQGSEGCYSASSSNPDTSLAVTYPASDPYVTGVGGTTLNSNDSQPVWNYCQPDESLSCASGNNGYNAGGGGLSQRWPEPSWQDGFNTWYWNPNANGNYPPCGQYCRGVPDITANAGAGELFYVNSAWEPLIGTSMAAPLLAGMFADITNTCYHHVGDANPALYAYAGISGAYGVGFNGVTQGNNDMTGTNGGDYPASSSGSWSPASGLGTPIASGLACPEVTSVQPPEATVGSQVTVAGSNLSLASFYFVTPSGTATKATVVSSSLSSATLVVPAGSGQVVIDASTPIGSGKYSQSFTYTTAVTTVTGPDPSTSIAGATGVTYKIGFTTSSSGALVAGSDTITLAGPTNTVFPSVASDYTVNGTAAGTVSSSTNAVTITTPVTVANSTAVTVAIGNMTNPPAGTYNINVDTSSDAAVVSTPSYTITVPPVPTIISISPTSGPATGGTAVSITGTNFSTTSGDTIVDFGSGNPATVVSCSSTTSCTGTSPPGTGTVSVTATTAGGSSNGVNYVYTPVGPPPTITSITPASSPLAGGGTAVIAGTNLSSASAVDLGSTPATNIKVISSTEVSVTIPAASSPRLVNATLITPGGSASTGFVYVTSGISYMPITPYRIADTRCAENPLPSTITSSYCSSLPGANAAMSSPSAGGSITIQVTGSGSGTNRVPSSAQSVILNVTITAGSTAHAGYLTVYPTGTNPPTASSLNYTPGAVIPNLVTATLGKGGAVSILSSSANVNIIVDVEGYYEPSSSSAMNKFDPLPVPIRALDTRCAENPLPSGITSSYCSPITSINSSSAPNSKGHIQVHVTGVGGSSGVPQSGVSAVSLVVTAAGPESGGYLTVWSDAGSCSTPPMTSNVNFHKGTASANSVIVEVGSTGKLCVYNSAATSTNAVVDINGYFSSTGGTFTPSSPVRICDTRSTSSVRGSDVAGGVSGQCANSGASLNPADTSSDPMTVQVTGIAGIPAGAKAVVANVTVVSTAGSGYLTVWAAGATQPNTSNVNWTKGQDIPDMVVSSLSSSGQIEVYASAGANVIIDVVGWYS